MSVIVRRFSAAGAVFDVVLSMVAQLHGRLFGLRPEAYLTGAALCLALALIALVSDG